MERWHLLTHTVDAPLMTEEDTDTKVWIHHNSWLVTLTIELVLCRFLTILAINCDKKSISRKKLIAAVCKNKFAPYLHSYNSPNELGSHCYNFDVLISLTHHYLSVGIIFAEAIQDDVGWDAHHTEDATPGAPADHLNSKGVFLHQLSCPAFTLLWLLKHFGGLQLVQHLKCDWRAKCLFWL